jgi:hypothetical protein
MNADDSGHNQQYKLSTPQRLKLGELLRECPSLKRQESRNTVIEQLSTAISSSVPRSNINSVDIANLVNTCMNHSNGINDLLDVLSFHEQGSIPFQRVLDYWNSIGKSTEPLPPLIIKHSEDPQSETNDVSPPRPDAGVSDGPTHTAPVDPGSANRATPPTPTPPPPGPTLGKRSRLSSVREWIAGKSKKLLGATALGVMGLIVAVCAWIYPNPPNPFAPRATATPQTGATSAATLPPTTPTLTASLTASPEPTQPTPTFGPLPESAPLLPALLLLSRFGDCGEIFSGFDQTLEASFADAAPEAPIAVAPLSTSITDSAMARAFGTEQKATVVVWSTCADNVATVDFEIMEQRGAPEVYEPTSFAVQLTSQSLLLDFTHALGVYSQRDYRQAADEFGQITKKFEQLGAIEPLSYLFQGNSLAFANQEREALAAFANIQEGQPYFAPSLYNQGLIERNLHWEDGRLDDAILLLTRTLAIDSDFMLAHSQLGIIWTEYAQVASGSSVDEYFSKAEQACTTANTSSDNIVRSMAELCMARIARIRYARRSVGSPEPTYDQGEEASTPFWAEPLYIEAMGQHDIWKRNEGRKDACTKTLAALRSYYNAASDDVVLSITRNDYDAAVPLLQTTCQ